MVPEGQGAEGLIVEASLDTKHMEIPAHLASRYPYYYDGTTTGPEQTEEESKLPNPKLGWTLTLVSSEPVKMSHDVAKERALAAVAYSWEDSQPGRADQATAVRTLYLSEKSSEEVAIAYPSSKTMPTPSPFNARRSDNVGPFQMTPPSPVYHRSLTGWKLDGQVHWARW